jgi:two-component system invasion response regulator UvrY
VRILLVDDHAVVRQGLRQILEEGLSSAEFGEAGSGGEALDLVRNEKWNVVVLDISIPDRSGLDVLKEIRHMDPRLPVLILSMHPEEQYGVRVLKAGAAGYMTKESAPDELVEAVKRVAANRKYVTQSLAEKLASDLSTDTDVPLHEKLSDREYQVMQLIAQGVTAKEIAGKLFLSPKTVSTYRRRVLDKMGMNNNAGLMHYAMKHGLVS